MPPGGLTQQEEAKLKFKLRVWETAQGDAGPASSVCLKPALWCAGHPNAVPLQLGMDSMLLNPTPSSAHARSPKVPGEQNWHMGCQVGPGVSITGACPFLASLWVHPQSPVQGLASKVPGNICGAKDRRGGTALEQLRACAVKHHKPGFESWL